jgi:nifR3 family TIM-barrel protein
MSFWRRISQPIIGLAPMDGVTDPAFRFIVAKHGKPDVLFTEFISVEEICHGGDSAWQQLRYSEIERPVVAQIYGSDPQRFYETAHIICELGFDGIDINMGCPSKNVSSRGCGAALIRNPALAQEIIRAVRAGVQDWASGHRIETVGLRSKVIAKIGDLSGEEAVAASPRRSIPISVKTRLGYDSVVIEDWVSVLLDESPEVISIHGRTLAQMYRGRADWEAIGRAAKLVRGTSTLLLGNGDIGCMAELVTRVLETDVHGVLIGRGGLGNPWIFAQKDHAKMQVAMKAVDTPESDIPLQKRFQVALEHACYFEAVGNRSRFAAMRKHLGWYCKGFPGAAQMRVRMFHTTSSLEVARVLAQFAGVIPESA